MSYRGEQMSHALLLRRRTEIQERHQRTMSKVNELVETQQQIGKELSQGVQTLSVHGDELDRLKQAEEESGLLAVLTRRFSARRYALSRKSVAEGLMRQYERVSVRLREATAFSDELRLCALELQDEVDKLHEQLQTSLDNSKTAADRVLAAEAELVAVEADDSLSPEERDRRVDAATFNLRSETVNLELYRAAAEHSRRHIEPARALRDTVLRLHEEMAAFVMSATHTVNSAGRRIQGLGMIADAPTVVTELQESLDELNSAMEATQAYVEQSQQLLSRVLPDLSARLKAEAEVSGEELTTRLDEVNREHAHSLAERALRDAALAEVDEFLGS